MRNSTCAEKKKESQNSSLCGNRSTSRRIEEGGPIHHFAPIGTLQDVQDLAALHLSAECFCDLRHTDQTVWILFKEVLQFPFQIGGCLRLLLRCSRPGRPTVDQERLRMLFDIHQEHRLNPAHQARRKALRGRQLIKPASRQIRHGFVMMPFTVKKKRPVELSGVNLFDLVHNNSPFLILKSCEE